MTSSRRTGEPARGGDEHDAFSRKAKRLLCYLQRSGVAAAAKRAFNRRAQRRAKALAELAELDADEIVGTTIARFEWERDA